MSTHSAIEIIECWSVTAIGVIAELKHQLAGLKSGTLLRSASTGEVWRIKTRLLFGHTYDDQKKFPEEIITYCHMSFESIEKRQVSARNILDKEEQHIYQYQLETYGHQSRLQAGDMLIVESDH